VITLGIIVAIAAVVLVRQWRAGGLDPERRRRVRAARELRAARDSRRARDMRRAGRW
jgi:hypothetical protein